MDKAQRQNKTVHEVYTKHQAAYLAYALMKELTQEVIDAIADETANLYLRTIQHKF